MPHREIERRFLVSAAHAVPFLARPGRRLVQGYLESRPSVRIRIAEDATGTRHAWLTLKLGTGMARDEFEYAIPPDDAALLLRACVASLAKVRREIPLDDGLTAELDVFEGPHAGLVLVEVELPDEAHPLSIPPWFGREVTDDPRYTNNALARAGRAPDDHRDSA